MRIALSLIAALFGFAASAQANVITVQGAAFGLQPNTPNQQITLHISGSDFYSDSNLRMQINGGVGPAPAITAVFGDNQTAIPVGNLTGSVWVNGFGGIAGPPNGTTLDSSGLSTEVSFGTAGFGSVNTQGIFAVLTISTVGAAYGDFSLTFEGTDLFNGLDENGDPVAAPLTLPQSISLSVIPEPSTYALAAIGVIALLTFERRKRSA